MAFSLLARNLNKPQYYTNFLNKFHFKNPRITISNKAAFNAMQKTSAGEQNKNIISITKPFVRNVAGAGDFRLMWTIERAFALTMVAVLPLTIAVPNALFDNIASIMVVLHFHWGLESMAGDYLRPMLVGDAISKAGLLAVYIISAVTLGGLLHFNYTDIGIGKTIRKFWAINKNKN